MSQLSAYRLMWIMTLFDLPTTTREERKEAKCFRDYLLDLGFEMAQYSVYMRMVSGKEQVESIYAKVKANLPEGGRVDLVTITDKQYENIYSFVGRVRQQRKNPQQFTLF